MGPSSNTPSGALSCRDCGGPDVEWTAEFHRDDTAAKDFPEVQVTKGSGGATFQFQPAGHCR